jgi:hypothetical protein
MIYIFELFSFECVLFWFCSQVEKLAGGTLSSLFGRVDSALPISLDAAIVSATHPNILCVCS